MRLEIVAISDANTMTPVVNYNDNTTYIWQINNPSPGSYLFRIASATNSRQPCIYRVFARSRHDLWFGVSTSHTDDLLYPQPSYSIVLIELA
jgi:hypothetical protein